MSGARPFAALLAVVVLTAGCSGGEKPEAGKNSPAPVSTPASAPPPPAGFTPARAGQVVLAHPAGWVKGPAPKGWTYMAELRAGAVIEARVGVITEVPQVPDPEIVIAGAATALQFNADRFQRGPNRPAPVPGAAGAVRVDYTYATTRGGPATARGTDVAVVAKNGSATVVRITGTQRTLSPGLVDQIVRTVALSA